MPPGSPSQQRTVKSRHITSEQQPDQLMKLVLALYARLLVQVALIVFGVGIVLRWTVLPFMISQRYPDIIIAGAPKCGTATLSYIMETHSAIVRTDDIEIQYYSRYLHLGKEWYLSKMPIAKHDMLILEKSPPYFYTPGVVPAILQTNPLTKVIIMLGDPVKRIESHYAMYERKNKTENKTLYEMVFKDDGEVNPDSLIVSISMYSDHLKQYVDLLPPHQLLLVDGDNLAKRPWEELVRVQDFLGISEEIKVEHFMTDKDGYFCWKKGHAQTVVCMDHSTKGTHHKHTFHVDAEKKLKDFFKTYDEELVYMLKGQRFLYMDQ